MYLVGLTITGKGIDQDLLVELGPDATTSDLLRVVAEKCPFSATDQHLHLSRPDLDIVPGAPVDEMDLRWGDVVEILAGAPTDGRARLVPFDSHLHELIVPAGASILGRDPATCTIAVGDDSVSRQHAALDSTDGKLVVTDLDSSNGTWIGDERISGSRSLTDGEIIGFGDTTFEVKFRSANSTTARRASQGVVTFNRQPRSLDPKPTSRFTVPAPPTKPPRRPLPIVAFITPLVGAVVTYAISHYPASLAMAALSPVAYFISHAIQTRSDEGGFKAKAATFRATLATAGEAGADAREAEAAWSERTWPLASSLVVGAVAHSSMLWWRRPIDADFLEVRVGVHEKAPDVEIAPPVGGDEVLLAEAIGTIANIRAPMTVPLVARLSETPVVGVVGDDAATRRFVKALLAQVAIEQSPRDVSIAVFATDFHEEFDDVKWLPHARQDGRTLIAANEDDEGRIFAQLKQLRDERQGQDRFGRTSTMALPYLLVVVKPPISISRPQVSELFGDLRSAGMSFIWIAADRTQLPGECRAVVQLRGDGRGRFESDEGKFDFAVETMDPTDFEKVARSLAPLQDSSASTNGGELPDSVALLDLLELADISSSDVAGMWQTPSGGLRLALGQSITGTFELDLEADGPHVLIAGMTGAGKSELLQTLVSSLALRYSPDRVNFVLVDYKGGSAFKSCRLLPHTVGFVTDLDGPLAERAIRSLSAELRRREVLITHEGGAKDIIDFRKLHPETPCPSLVIVIDEFAFLSKELPTFVERLVDIAQRGRSLGVHLVLATQRPSGVISPQIQANTNLRIALRVANAADSTDVIESTSASTIASRLRGRAYVKAGPDRPVMIQAAYVGNARGEPTSESTGRAMTFRVSRTQLRASEIAETFKSDSPSDLDRIVAAVEGAEKIVGQRPPRSPLLDPLPTVLTQEELVRRAGTILVDSMIGVLDEPDLQRQDPWLYDCRSAQNVLLLGGPRSGKTTAMLAMALSLSREQSDSAPWIYGFDFGHNGLAPLSGLPGWGGTATPQNPEKVARLISLLDELVAQRQTSGLAAKDRRPVVVFVDNWSALYASLQSIEMSVSMERLVRLVSDGRGSGLYFVASADRAAAISASVGSSIETEFVFRITNSQDLPTSARHFAERVATLPPGRAIDARGNEIQFVMPELAPSAESRSVEGNVVFDLTSQPTLRLLPSEIELQRLGASSSLASVMMGLDERWWPVSVDLASSPNFLVAGNPRSGKSTALRSLVTGVVSTGEVGTLLLVSARRSPLSEMDVWSDRTSSADDAGRVVAAARDSIKANVGRVMLVVDDGDDLADLMSPVAASLDALLKTGLDNGLIFVTSVSTAKAQRTFSSWLGTLRTHQHGLLLGGGPENADVFQSRLPRAIVTNDPPGRGYLFTSRGYRRVQVGLPS